MPCYSVEQGVATHSHLDATLSVFLLVPVRVPSAVSRKRPSGWLTRTDEMGGPPRNRTTCDFEEKWAFDCVSAPLQMAASYLYTYVSAAIGTAFSTDMLGWLVRLTTARRRRRETKSAKPDCSRGSRFCRLDVAVALEFHCGRQSRAYRGLKCRITRHRRLPDTSPYESTMATRDSRLAWFACRDPWSKSNNG